MLGSADAAEACFAQQPCAISVGITQFALFAALSSQRSQHGSAWEGSTSPNTATAAKSVPGTVRFLGMVQQGANWRGTRRSTATSLKTDPGELYF